MAYVKSNKNINKIKMEFKRRFGKQRKAKPKKGLFLVILLVLVLYLFFNADKIIGRYF